MVIVSPPAVGPEVGEIEEIVGALGSLAVVVMVIEPI
jgi:hypothetical protein